MKQIIDNETGEVIEVANENELVEKKLYEIGIINDEIMEEISKALYYKEWIETFKYQLEKAMRENGIKKWDNDSFTATLKEETIQKRVDNERLKEDGLYEKYLKLVPVKASMMLKFKERK